MIRTWFLLWSVWVRPLRIYAILRRSDLVLSKNSRQLSPCPCFSISSKYYCIVSFFSAISYSLKRPNFDSIRTIQLSPNSSNPEKSQPLYQATKELVGEPIDQAAETLLLSRGQTMTGISASRPASSYLQVYRQRLRGEHSTRASFEKSTRVVLSQGQCCKSIWGESIRRGEYLVAANSGSCLQDLSPACRSFHSSLQKL